MEAGRDGRFEQVDLVNQEAGREAVCVKQVTVVPFFFYTFFLFLRFFFLWLSLPFIKLLITR